MKKNTRFLVAGLLTATMLIAPVAALAQEKSEKPNTPAAGADRPAPANRALPFRGTVAAVDKDAKTVTVGKMVLHVSSETKLTKAEKPATVADIVVGDVIGGNYTKGEDGKLTAKMMRVGPKPPAAPVEKKPAEKKKDKETNSPQ
jgi:hypothetical protein